MTKDATMPAPSDGGTVRGESEGEETRESEYFTEAEMASLDPKLQALARRNSKPGPFGLKTQLVWRNVFLIGGLHVLMLYGGYLGLYAKWQSYAWYVTVGMCSAFGVTAGAHRLWTTPQLQGETAPENSPDVLRLRRHAELHPRLVT